MKKEEIIIYQAKNGKIEFQGDFKHDNFWGTQKQISELFNIDRSVVTKHINKIIKDKEVEKKSNVQKMHIPNSDKLVKLYSLDIILAVGYRTNSTKAIHFRKWSTNILKKHIIQGYTINKKTIGRNYQKFMNAVADVKALLPDDTKIQTSDILELIRTFASTWLSLKAYDTETFPKKGITKKRIAFTAEELNQVLQELKKNLISKKQATDIFGQERNKNSIQGIIGNIFQSAFGMEMYPTIEEKAAHLLYFMVKNHPFIDGNKRNGAFAFIWFLRKTSTLRASLTPEALTALTLFIAESKTEDKNKMIGLVLLLLKK